jgi:hypothetical protein
MRLGGLWSRRRVVFLTRAGCRLCDEALIRVRRVCSWLGRTVMVREITEDRVLENEYHLRIPVLLDEQGRVLAEGTMATRELLRAVWRS